MTVAAGPWDAGLIPSWRLLRRVDAEITRLLVRRKVDLVHRLV